MIKINMTVRFKLSSNSNKDVVEQYYGKYGFYEMELSTLLELYKSLITKKWMSPFEGGDIAVVVEEITTIVNHNSRVRFKVNESIEKDVWYETTLHDLLEKYDSLRNFFPENGELFIP